MRYALVLFLLVIAHTARSQQYPVDTLRFHGDPDAHINLVVLGDGYTAAEQATFVQDARDLTDYLLTQSPWSHYTSYFNVFAIEVPSPESGTSHPNTAPDCTNAGVPTIAVSTRFKCSFDAFGIHRLVVPSDQAAIAAVLADNFPNYDQVLMVAHSPYYGGSGGSFATATVNTSSDEIVAHEIGHSFAALADEYWAGPQYAAEKPNMTRQSDPGLIRWTNWLTTGTGVSIYPHSGDPSWFKPSESCKMQALGNPYCAVCSEAIVERIHSLVSPIVRYSPSSVNLDVATSPVVFSLDTLIAPTPNTIRVQWTVDGVSSGNLPQYTLDAAKLVTGSHTVVASVLDTTWLVRADNHLIAHVYTVTWNVTKTTAVVITPQTNKLKLSLFPNPVSAEVHITVVLEKPEQIAIDLCSIDGRVLKRIAAASYMASFDEKISLAGLASGTHLIRFQIGGATESLKFVKE